MSLCGVYFVVVSAAHTEDMTTTLIDIHFSRIPLRIRTNMSYPIIEIVPNEIFPCQSYNLRMHKHTNARAHIHTMMVAMLTSGRR